MTDDRFSWQLTRYPDGEVRLRMGDEFGPGETSPLAEASLEAVRLALVAQSLTGIADQLRDHAADVNRG